jgi:hypothetical protein
MRLAVQGPWSIPPESFQNTQFLRSWFEYDSEMRKTRPHSGVNWQLIFGILLLLGISVGFWAGAAWLVARYWK